MAREVGGSQWVRAPGTVSEQREQRKSSEIKTNAVCGNTETRSPCPGRREPPSSSSGAWPRGAGGAPAGGFPPGRPSAGLARVSGARWAAHARVCMCARLHTLRRVRTPAPTPSLGPRARGLGRPISAPPGGGAVRLWPPGRISAGRARRPNHSRPSSVPAPPRSAAAPPAGRGAGNSEWRSPPPPAPAPTPTCGGGRAAAGKPERAPRGRRRPLPAPPRGQPAPRRRGQSDSAARPDGGHLRARTPAPDPGPAGPLPPPPGRLTVQIGGRQNAARPRLSRPSSRHALGPSIPLPPRAPSPASPS